MKVFIKNKDELTFPCDTLILPVTEDKGIGIYKNIDSRLNSLIKGIIKSGEFSGKQNQTTLLHTQGKIKPDRILLIGLGTLKEVTREKLRQAGGKATDILQTTQANNSALSTLIFRSLRYSPADFLEGVLLNDYSFRKYKRETVRKGIEGFTLLTEENLRKEIRWKEAAVSASHLARDLVNTPSNDLTPSALVKAARALKNISVKVINRNEAEKLGMGAYLSVARGSHEPPRFIVMTYKGNNNPPVVLIGKSITFDSGGISLKPAMGMEKMKYDMAGGAAVLGTMKALTEMNLPLHVIAVLPATENLPGGSASKPGDVVRSMGGKTIEIISTDAEGRLVLADALGYVKKFRPSAVIDIATLTGACSIALGNEAMAMMGNSDSLMKKIKKASDETGEKVWQMPLFDEYKDYIKSDIADLKNSAGRSGGLVTAGYFLKEFAGDVPWVHLDIAGTAWTDKGMPYIPAGATGIGARLLLSFLKSLNTKG